MTDPHARPCRAAYDQGYSDGQVGEYQPEKYATPDRVAKLALAVSDAFEAYTKEPTPYNEGLLQGLQLAADIIGKNP